ncbi:MAG TPA: S49 family peptidase [Ignavibacteriaceae bacterium]|nr:S49 family peptidase [Ignavibacteriaceae bacterium]
MKRLVYFLVSFIFFSLFSTFAQSNSTFYNRNYFSLTSPGAMKYGLYGFDNPAVLSTLNGLNLQFNWSDYNSKEKLNNWGLFAAVPNLGFSMVKMRSGAFDVTDYNFALAMGNKSISTGFSYGWSDGNRTVFNRRNLYTVGLLIRPFKYVSFGAVGLFPESRTSEGYVDLAIRPFGNEWLSVFGDYLFKKQYFNDEQRWSAGASVELLSGLRLVGRYFNNEFITAGLEVSLGSLSFSGQGHFTKNKETQYNTYGIRIGENDRSFWKYFNKNDNYAEFNLLGQVNYQRYKWFDNSNSLRTLLEQIKAAKEDITISGIAINTSGMQINKEMLWELREALKNFKSAGKKVVVYVDRVNIDGYYLASIADKIVLDPMGQIILEGYLMGRTFYKNTLDKLGIGFTEWRYFKYKSAEESFSRTDMSEADAEQRQKIVDEVYNLVRNDICNDRGFTREQFDNFVDSNFIFIAGDAIKKHLVDTLARWNDVKDLIAKWDNDKKGYKDPNKLEKFNLPDDNHWGEKPQIAVIYAIGACAMDGGINARSLVNDVQNAFDNDRIKAIVLRVDSPGGDALASDLIAEVMKKNKGKKPVIVSQGYVAASGGYWLSMYGDTIVAAPNTITSSIGVIGGWFYNKELKDKLGFTTDFVKKGKHADLGFGFSLPLINIGLLPDRDLTKEEQTQSEFLLKSMYREFITKVSEGRKLSYDYVDSIAQGRVWAGTDGIKLKIVDVLGGLDDAIMIAKQKTGLIEGEYNLIELPEPSLFNFSALLGGMVGIETDNKYEIKYDMVQDLKFRLENNGKVMPLLPIMDLYK